MYIINILKNYIKILSKLIFVLFFILFANLIVFTGISYANTKTNNKNLKAGIGLGISNTTGTIPSFNINTRDYLKYKNYPWRHKLRFVYNYITEYSQLSYLRLIAQENSSYYFNKTSYIFADERFDRNIVTGFGYRIYENIGYGKKFIISKNMNSSIELAPGLRQEKIIGGPYFGSVTTMIRTKYHWKLNKGVKFKEEITAYLANKGGSLYESLTKLSTKIVKNVYLAIYYELEYQTLVPAGFKPFNTISSININVKF